MIECADADCHCGCSAMAAEITRLTSLSDMWKARAEYRAKRMAELEAENTRLRAALANSQGACVYCSLPAEEWNKCQQGFPGCARADDAMGCPELGARMALDQAEKQIADLQRQARLNCSLCP